MRLIAAAFAITALILSSCKTVSNTENSFEYTEVPVVGTIGTVTGMVHMRDDGPLIWVVIIDINGIGYTVISDPIVDELRWLQGYLIEFTIVYEEYRETGLYRGRIVTPIEWKVINDDSFNRTEIITTITGRIYIHGLYQYSLLFIVDLNNNEYYIRPRLRSIENELRRLDGRLVELTASYYEEDEEKVFTPISWRIIQ